MPYYKVFHTIRYDLGDVLKFIESRSKIKE